jgi:hypothetical protein
MHQEDCLERAIACFSQGREGVAGSVPDLVSLVHKAKLPASLIGQPFGPEPGSLPSNKMTLQRMEHVGTMVDDLAGRD